MAKTNPERKWPSHLNITQTDIELITSEAERVGIIIPTTQKGIADYLGKMVADSDLNN